MFDVHSTAYHIFKYLDKSYIFDSYQMILCEINQQTYKALKEKNLKSLNQSDLDSLSYIAENGIFCNYNIPSKHEPDTYHKAYFSLAPMHNCNLKCQYCFASSGDVYKAKKRSHDEGTLNRIADFICKTWMPDCNDFRLDFVSGGEPLINKMIFRNTVTTIINAFKKYDRRLFVWLCTNGTLLQNDDLSFFNEHGIHFGVSLDGTPEQNKLRVYNNGERSYDDVLKSLLLVKHSDFPKRLKELWGLAVVTEESGNLVELLKHHINLGFQTIQMKMVRLSKTEDLSFKSTNIEHLKEWIVELYDYVVEEALVNNNINPWLTFLNDNDYFGKITRRILLKQPYDYRCYAARAKLSFTPEGKIYPCDSFIGLEQFCLGDIYNGLDQAKVSIFENQSVHDREPCRECWAKFVCSGDCFHNSFLTNGEISSPDPWLCEIVKFIAEYSIVCIDKLVNGNFEAYELLIKILNVRQRVKH